MDGELFAAREGTPLDFRDARRDGDVGQVLAALEGIPPDFLDARRDGHAGQFRAAPSSRRSRGNWACWAAARGALSWRNICSGCK